MKPASIVILILILSACAQIVPPSGGIKDEKPPVLLKSSPRSGSTNLFPKKITLYFNENIELKDKGQINITPETNIIPTFKTSRKQIIIGLNKDSLKPNTTYSVNFGKSIADLNEGNIYKDYNYIFSTGNFIDTAYLNGTAFQIKSNTPEEHVTVRLTALNKNIQYSTFTDQEGKWSLFNISPGNYALLMFKDKNSNKLLDNNEMYFVKNITVPDTTSSYKTKLITYYAVNSASLKVEKVHYLNDYVLSVKLNKAPENYRNIKYSLTKSETKKESPLHSTLQNDSFLLYHTFFGSDTLNLTIQTDTIQSFSIIQPKKRNKSELIIKPEILSVRKEDPIRFISSVPITLINSRKIKINDDSTNFEVELKTPLKIEINDKNSTHKNIIFMPGAFQDINGNENKADTLLIKIEEEEKTGNYEFVLKDSLINFSGKVMVKITGVNNEYIIKTRIGKINKLNGFLAGNYDLEIWEDLYENDTWDEGNYFENIVPEKIRVLKNFITIKPNWDTLGVEIYLD